jgi:TonB-linked SusC/RagA family outer membrane protein
MIMLAQQKPSISGTIVDIHNEPVIGASILEKGTSNGTITNDRGEFSMKISSGATLVISYIGCITQEIVVGNKSTLNVTLLEDSKQLEEVVVVGYGVQKKSSMTAAVATVSAKEIAKQVTSNVASALQGRTPGVEVLQNGGEAGGDVSILIRGAGTFGSTEPLYIIDGAVSNNGINSLNPNDIESIEILKDGSAAAIYGSRAANGVILVTTKSGKSGKTKIEINGAYSYQTPSKKLDFMNAEQWRGFANMVADNSPSFNRATQNVNPTNPDLSTDWQDIYYQNAGMWNLSGAVSGGGENSTFSTSVGYTNQNGIIIQSDYEKYNARVNGTYKKGRFTISENLSLAHIYRKSPPAGRSIMLPTLPVKDELGRYISAPLSAGYSTTNIDIINPLAEIYARDSYTRKTDITGSLSVGVEIWKGLKYKLNLAGSYLNTHGYIHTPEYASYWDQDGNPDSHFSQPYTSLSESRGEDFNYTIDNLLTYNNTFGGHTFDVLLGTSWMREYNRTMSINSGVSDLGAPSVTTFNGSGTVGSNEMNSALLSFFARLNYDYNNRYLLSLSIRSDESSKFAKGHRVGYFPSVSAGWNVHQEKFYNIPWMSKLKIRASYGELGANFIDPYSFLSLAYGPVPAIFNNTRQYGYVTRLAQTNLTWETAVSSNFAVEMGFLDNALNFTAEYFLKRNNDLLAPLESLPSSGQTIIVNDGNLPYYNTASVENKGLEFTLGYRKSWKDWNIDLQGNIAFLKNKVRKLGEGVQPIRGNLMSSKFSDRPTITKEGLPIGSFYGYKVMGISDSGDFLFEGADGKAKVASEVGEADKQVLGNPTPDYTYGLNFNVSYKNWDLTAFFQGTQGNDIFAAAKYQFYFNYDNNNLTDALNSWTSTNKNTSLPIAKTDNYNGGNSLPSSFYVEDGSYFRCKNLQIGYMLDKKLLSKLGFIESARLFAGVQNLFTITKYPLYDPEVGSNTLFDRGVDGLYQNAPRINSRTYNFGFSLTF